MSGQNLRTITFKLSESERKIIDTYCEQEHRTMSEVLREYIRGLERKIKNRK